MYHLKRLIEEKKPNNGSFYLIAIDGRGGAGKSTLLDYLKTILPGYVFISGDDYFEPANDGIAWGAFNDARFVDDVISKLQQSRRDFAYRPFDWHSVPHIKEREISIERGLVLERGYSFKFDLDWDLRIWVETKRGICLDRGVERDHMAKGKEIVAWQEWQDKEDDYIKETRPLDLADIVVDGTKPFIEQLILE